jgi:hypothetical protein
MRYRDLIEGTDFEMNILPVSFAAKMETVSSYPDDHKQSTLQFMWSTNRCYMDW